MWSLLAVGVKELIQSWFGVKKAENDAKAAMAQQNAKIEGDWDTQALKASQSSWKDELILLVWLAPLIVAWFAPVRAMAWIAFATALPYWWWFGMMGMIAATFGLRWYFKQQGLKVLKDVKSK